MELKYPFVLLILIIFLIILIFRKFNQKEHQEEGKKVANTKFVKEIPYYKKAIRKYKILTFSLKAICIISIILAGVLIARPQTINIGEDAKYSRDIILCLDVSTSINSLNEKLTNKLKEIVKSLKGERFGIIIFNTSSTQLVPLTDDYEYVLKVLNDLEENFKIQNEYMNSENKEDAKKASKAAKYLQSGTSVGSSVRGSSIIGDGLASCITNFGNLEEERTRVIIFSTDNELYGKELITLEEASVMCKERNITVFAVAPSSIQKKDILGLKSVAEITGGEYYEEGDKSSSNVDNIVKNIERKSKNLVKNQKNIEKIDKPELIEILLIVSVIGLFILDKKVSV